MSSSEVEKLLKGSLIKWLVSCLKNSHSLKSYKNLVDGQLLHEIFLQIDTKALYDGILIVNGNTSARVNNLRIVWKNIRYFYEEELGYIIVKLPDIVKLAEEPDTHVEDIKLVLTFLLGCAVQCANKENFIEKIKTMDENTQLAIMDYIKDVTENVDIVLTLNSIQSINAEYLYNIIKKLSDERCDFSESYKNIITNCASDRSEYYSLNGDLNYDEFSSFYQHTSSFQSDANDSIQQVKKLQQEQGKLKQALAECMEDLEEKKTYIDKLQEEKQGLFHEVRYAKYYRDNMDAVLEKAARADRLEQEVASYKDKMEDNEFYKRRIEELLKDNELLVKIRKALEDQLSNWKQRSDEQLNYQKEIVKYKKLLEEKTLEQAADREKYFELFEENSRLQNSTKLEPESKCEISILEPENVIDESTTATHNLSVEFVNNLQARILQLELENHRLQTLTESSDQNSSQLLKLMEKYKKMSLKVKTLTSENKKFKHQNKEFDAVSKQALLEIENLIKATENHRRRSIENQQRYSAQQCKYDTLLEKYIDIREKYMEAYKEKKFLQDLLKCAQIDGSSNSIKFFIPNEDDLQSTVSENLISVPVESEKGSTSREDRFGEIERTNDRHSVDDFIQRDILTYNVMALTAMFIFWRCFDTS